MDELRNNVRGVMRLASVELSYCAPFWCIELLR